jgi:hypothetical protein
MDVTEARGCQLWDVWGKCNDDDTIDALLVVEVDGSVVHHAAAAEPAVRFVRGRSRGVNALSTECMVQTMRTNS